MKIYLRIFILLIVFIIAASCKKTSRTGNEAMIFCYNEPSNITSLDPAFARSMANIWAVNQIFNGLVQLDSSLKIIPSIARSWEISEDGKRYTFHLRDDVLFHDDVSLGAGRKVTASDFVYSFRRILDPATASPGTWIFRNIKRDSHNIPAFFAPDDTTLIIELNEVFPPFLGLLAMQYCSVVPHEALDYYGADFRKQPVGTGPFRFQFWKENNRLVLLKNPDYFELDSAGNRLPYLDAVNITFIVDRQTAFLDFLKGNIHMISGIDATYKDALLDRDGQLKAKYKDEIYLLSEPFLNTEYLGFHLGNEDAVFQDVRIRKALNHCFDRKKMIRYLRNNMGTPGIYGFVPPFMPGFSDADSHGFHYDPEYSKLLLAEAGFPGGKGLPPIKLTITANYLDLCQFIQHEAQRAGISIKIDVTPPATLREMISGGNVDFFRASWIADYPDAENYLSLFSQSNFPPGGPNYTRYSSDAYEKLFEKAVSTTDDSLRFRYYRELDSLVMADSPVIILYYDMVVRFVRKEVSGLSSNPMNLLTLKYTRMNN